MPGNSYRMNLAAMLGGAPGFGVRTEGERHLRESLWTLCRQAGQHVRGWEEAGHSGKRTEGQI